MNTELRMACIFRADITIPTGKALAQAGHAFLTAWRNATDREQAEAYASGSQAKIVLDAPDVATLYSIIERAEKRGIAYALITDEGRTVFGGEPTITCLGLSPMDKTSYNNITRGLNLTE